MSNNKTVNSNGGSGRRFGLRITTFHSLWRSFINFFYPNICPCCEAIIESDSDFCSSCKNSFTIFDYDFEINYADDFVAYCIYEGEIRNAVRKFKYDYCGNSYYAFAFCILQALRRKQLTSDIDLVTYIPMTKSDLKSRGYNQTKMIAKEIYYQSEIPCMDILVKVKETKAQKSLNRDERRDNLYGAFNVRNNVDLKGKCVLIVDDLCTTGSTLSEAARVLKEAGAEKVIAASFAKTKKL